MHCKKIGYRNIYPQTQFTTFSNLTTPNSTPQKLLFQLGHSVWYQPKFWHFHTLNFRFACQFFHVIAYNSWVWLPIFMNIFQNFANLCLFKVTRRNPKFGPDFTTHSLCHIQNRITQEIDLIKSSLLGSKRYLWSIEPIRRARNRLHN